MVGVALVAGAVVMVLAWPTLGYISASSRVVIVGKERPNRDGLPVSIKKDLIRQIAVPAAMGHPGRGDWKPDYPHAPGAAGVGRVTTRSVVQSIALIIIADMTIGLLSIQ